VLGRTTRRLGGKDDGRTNDEDKRKMTLGKAAGPGKYSYRVNTNNSAQRESCGVIHVQLSV